jgi:hypothetical protein
MKKLILISLCLFACALTLSAQQTIYVIDNVTIEHFDGSQLKGKNIRDYKITTTGSGRKAITVHSITTSRSAFTAHFYNPHLDSLKTPEFSEFKTFQADTLISLKDVRVISTTPRKVVYVIDGVRHDDAKAFNSLSPMDIENITVIKDDSPEAKAYGENVSVIKIQTKKGGNGLMESLKNLPGVKVEADGSITANGQPIKKITINGSSYSIGAEE